MESKIPAVEVKLGFKWQGLLIAVIIGLGIWLIPTPEGLSAKAWGMLALFVATIVAIIAKAIMTAISSPCHLKPSLTSTAGILLSIG